MRRDDCKCFPQCAHSRNTRFAPKPLNTVNGYFD
ncbi:hypothetical protein Pla123a_05240 [Posidoniimonas polymericola]|uniref:Uncharacterized protein n=1 Tax=Posidoniimonas polymericola TaxID=2528002 RepID=A0A5C5ZF78_9BACT|nr:hypothetical protein Pla123a_05240 [Posidoniimonas polymericola]